MVTGSFSLVGIEDGIGNETIFTITSTSNKPGRPSSVNTDGYVPDGWYANPQDVSATYQYQWVCKREKKEGNWGAWSEPSLYSNFADGIKYVLNYYGLSPSATTEPTSWSLTPPTMSSTMRYLWNYEIVGLNSGETYETDRTVIGVYGDDGEPGTPGADGVGIDYIREYYLATSQSSGVTTSTSGWTMSIQTITSTKKYLWNYEVIMYTNGYRDVGDPKIIGVYGDKGNQGDPGQDGADGTDGKGYEYCYNYTTVNVRPETPTSSANDNVTPAGWYTYPPSISASRPYIWECQRVKSNGVWSAWSTPTLKNRWAYDGANGDKGAKMRMRTWESGVRYLQGAEGEEFYDIVVYETKLYLCTKTHTSSSSNNPIESIESYLGYWESAQQWTFIATQLLLAGKIVSDKITADLIDATGITAKDADISGKITATSGKIGGWSIVGNNLECYGFNTKINVEASGGRFMRINNSETTMCYIRADGSTALQLATFGEDDSTIGLHVLCNAAGYGKAIEAYGNIILNARPDEDVSIKGLKLNIRSVSYSQDINRNDDYLLCSGNITIKLPSPQAVEGKIYHIRRSSGTLTLTCYYLENPVIKPFYFLDGRNDTSTQIRTSNLHTYISNGIAWYEIEN